MVVVWGGVLFYKGKPLMLKAFEVYSIAKTPYIMSRWPNG